jgi:hypothetical protein
MNEQKIDKTFHGAYSEIERLTKVFRKGGLLEKAIMEVGGDPAYMDDVRSAMDAAYDALSDAHYGALAHLEMEESVNEAAAKIACVECDEVSTAAAWKKNNGFCPKCKTSSQGVAESKAVKGKKLTEGVLDNDDEDGFMARSQLYFMAKDAIALHGMIGDKDNLEPWVQAKITNAAEGLDAVRRYTEYQAIKAQSQLPVPVEEPEGPPAPEEMEETVVIEARGLQSIDWPDEDMAQHAENAIRHGMHAYDAYGHVYSMTLERDWMQAHKDELIKMFASYGLATESVAEGKKKQIDRNGDGKNDWEDVKLARKAAAAKAQKKPVEEELKVVAQDMFKNALSAAKKRAQ